MPSKDLLVTTHTPTLGSGRALRTYALARALATHGRLDLLYVPFGASEPDEAFCAIPGIELHRITPSRGAHRLLAYATARVRGVPDQLARGASPELAEQASRMAALKDSPGGRRVIADGPTAAAALWGLARKRSVIYNAHNLESSFRHEIKRHGLPRPGHRFLLRSFERRLLARFAEAWMVSEADMEMGRALCPRARLRYVPNVVDVAAIAPVGQIAAEPRAIFVASFDYPPNRNALRFLLEEVFPRVWLELPAARLAVVGGGLARPASTDPRVETLGFVEDLSAAYAQARCAVVPLLQSGGTPLKLIEALAHGLPVLATPRAAAGLAIRDGESCVLADGAAAFAGALVRLLREGAPELGRRGRQLVEERYSIEALSALVAPPS
jgi:glycosyltransferase involved in cell wall biosynthesis